MLRSLPRPSRPANLALAAIAALVLAASAQAAPIATFDVSMTGVVSGPTTGTSSGSGGIAVLDDTGVLSWTITTQAVTSLTNSLQDLDVLFTGSFAGDTLTVSTASFVITGCVDNGGLLNACTFLGPLPTLPNDYEDVDPSSIVFDLTLGGTTIFDTTDIGQATTVSTWTLTTIPEPGAAPLLGLGLATLAFARRRP